MTFSGIISTRVTDHMVSPAGSVDRQRLHIGEARDYIIGNDTYLGEVLHLARSYMWIRPLGPLPSEVETMLSEASEGGRRLYVAMADVYGSGCWCEGDLQGLQGPHGRWGLRGHPSLVTYTCSGSGFFFRLS